MTNQQKKKIEIAKELKITKLKKIALETVDIKGIGFYTLGSTRKTLSEDQKKNMLFYLIL